MSEHLADEPTGLFPVTLELPAGLLAAYDALVKDRIYPDRASALLHGLVQSWRHDQGTFHSIRLDWLSDARDQEKDTAQAETSDVTKPGHSDN